MDNEELIILPESLLEEQIQIPKTLAAAAATCSPEACEYIGQGPCGQMCDPSCQDNMCGGCQTVCNSCEGSSCQTCQTACQSSCQTTCERYCETDCEYCETACQLSCQTGCQVSCQTGCEVSCQTGCQVSCQCSVQGGQGTPPSYSVSAGINSITFSYTNGTVDYNYNYWTVYVVEGSTQIYKEWVSASTRTHTVTGLSAGTTYTVNVGYTNSYGAGDVGKIGSRTVTTDTPPTYTVTVISYTNGSEYDRGSFSITGGSSISALTAWQRSGIDTDGDFSYWTFNGGSSISDMSETRTVNANSTVRIYFTKTTYSEVNFNTFIDGSLYDAKTASFAAQSHTYQFWLDNFKNNYGLRIPSGDFVDIYNGSTKVSLSSTLSVDGVHNVVVNVYYETHRVKAHIYVNGVWREATAYIFNGTQWVEAEPNIYDGGWN